MADTQEEFKADCSHLLFQQRADEPPSSGPLLSSSSPSAHCRLRTYFLHHMRQSTPLKEFRAECGGRAGTGVWEGTQGISQSWGQVRLPAGWGERGGGCPRHSRCSGSISEHATCYPSVWRRRTGRRGRQSEALQPHSLGAGLLGSFSRAAQCFCFSGWNSCLALPGGTAWPGHGQGYSRTDDQGKRHHHLTILWSSIQPCAES